MPILYSVISRGTTVLAKFAECVGNFAEVTEQIMSKISLENHKLTYSHGNYLIHYNCENKIIYMCITDDEFERTRAFLFLADIKQKFIQTYGLTVATAIAYAMNSEFSKVLAEQMVFFSQSREVDAISRVHGQIDELKHIMVKNIDSLKDRGEKLELLVNKAEHLDNNSVSFRNASRSLARKMFWKNIRLYVVVGVIIVFVIYVIISMACGGLAWQTCIHNN
ncbi:vesicle-associated membrane protein 7 isoform X1 [Episyrphus balteatus]|uniref:vesicle-associated membrane protein 7 isoform X1 n=1 Tax=Episyrphus balteatus TaxID=286459 RepID=UPI002484E42D|nr:vesicle-associated membrane protein 7 isoform X1 [Episyrphus balteatus]